MKVLNLAWLRRTTRCALAAASAMVFMYTAGASPSRADFYVTFQEEGGPVLSAKYYIGTNNTVPTAEDPLTNLLSIQVQANGDPSAPDFSVGITAGDSSSPSMGVLSSQTIDVRNNSASSHVLDINVFNSDYTVPNAPTLSVESKLGGVINQGGISFSSTFSSPLQALPTLSDPANNTTAQDVLTPVSQTGSGFTLTQTLKVTLGSLQQVNMTAADLVTVPEPKALVACMGLIGMMGVGLVWQRRRVAASLV